MPYHTDTAEFTALLRAHIPELRRLVSERFSLTPDQLEPGFDSPEDPAIPEPSGPSDIAEHAASLISALYSDRVRIGDDTFPALSPLTTMCPDIDDRLCGLSWAVTKQLAAVPGQPTARQLHKDIKGQIASDKDLGHHRWRNHLVYLLATVVPRTIDRAYPTPSTPYSEADDWTAKKLEFDAAIMRAAWYSGQSEGRLTEWLNHSRGSIFDETVEGLTDRLHLLYELHPQATE